MKTDTLYGSDGTATTVAPSNGKNYKLNELYKMLGCSMVEVVYTPTQGIILICDEEGLFNGATINRQASAIAGRPIVGAALMCDTKRFK